MFITHTSITKWVNIVESSTYPKLNFAEYETINYKSGSYNKNFFRGKVKNSKSKKK